MRASILEGAALLLALSAALCADSLPDNPLGPLALLSVLAVAGLLVALAHRLPHRYTRATRPPGSTAHPPRKREQKESRPGVVTTGTACRKDKAYPIIPRPYFTGAKGDCQIEF